MKKDETKQMILSAAKKEFAEKGFSGARMSSIAESSGANQALIHYYFESKENLYITILDQLFSVEDRNSISIEKPQWDLTVPQKLCALLYYIVHIHVVSADRDAYRILAWEMAEGHTYIRPFVDKYIVPRLEAIKELISCGVEMKIFETENVDLSALAILSMISGFEEARSIKRRTGEEVFLYSEKGGELFAPFFINTSFRMITPKNEKTQVPELPGEVKKFLDKLISHVKDDKSSEFNCEILSQFLTLIAVK